MLTPKEFEVLNLVSKGYSTRKIAVKLKISGYTVEGYRKMLLKKLKARNSVELVRKAFQLKWLS
jgi:two-component system, NarL family, response regulator NreC